MITPYITLLEKNWRLHISRPLSLSKKILKALEKEVDLPFESEVSLVFSDDTQVQELNKRFRHKDKPTNVLSFPQERDFAGGSLGDVILSFQTCWKEAEEQKKPFLHHTTHLLVHGLLHLLGYDHETDDEANEMEKLETQILTHLQIPDPYADHS